MWTRCGQSLPLRFSPIKLHADVRVDMEIGFDSNSIVSLQSTDKAHFVIGFTIIDSSGYSVFCRFPDSSALAVKSSRGDLSLEEE